MLLVFYGFSLLLMNIHILHIVAHLPDSQNIKTRDERRQPRATLCSIAFHRFEHFFLFDN